MKCGGRCTEVSSELTLSQIRNTRCESVFVSLLTAIIPSIGSCTVQWAISSIMLFPLPYRPQVGTDRYQRRRHLHRQHHRPLQRRTRHNLLTGNRHRHGGQQRRLRCQSEPRRRVSPRSFSERSEHFRARSGGPAEG